MKIRQRTHSIKSTKILQWIEKSQTKKQRVINRTIFLQIPSDEVNSANQYELTKALRDNLMKNVSNKKDLMKKIQSYSVETSVLGNTENKTCTACHLTIHLK